jgi:hypothetical protein
MVTKKSWNEFRETGLFVFINSILHAFGWAIVVEVDESGDVKNCYPARVKYRGFTESDTEESHKRIGNYLKENAEQLAAEVNEP